MYDISLHGREAVRMGQTFHIDLTHRSLRIGCHHLITDGVLHKGVTLGVRPIKKLSSVLTGLEYRYQIYKHSRPSARDEHRRYFLQALPYKRLSRQDLTVGKSRQEARFELEFYLLAHLLDGSLRWDDTRPDMQPKFWFWRSANDRDLVLPHSIFNNPQSNN